MEFISVEEFINQSKEVQEVFRDWCENNLEVNDYVVPINPETNEVVDSICRINQCLDTRQHKVNVGRVFYLETCLLYDTVFEFVPLLTEGQLRKFINKYKYEIEIDELNGKFQLICWQEGRKYYVNSGKDLLQVYWEVAREIAKESVGNGL